MIHTMDRADRYDQDKEQRDVQCACPGKADQFLGNVDEDGMDQIDSECQRAKPV